MYPLERRVAMNPNKEKSVVTMENCGANVMTFGKK